MGETKDLQTDLQKIIDVLGSATKTAGLAVVVYLLRTVLSDLVITGGAVTAIYFITKIWVE